MGVNEDPHSGGVGFSQPQLIFLTSLWPLSEITQWGGGAFCTLLSIDISCAIDFCSDIFIPMARP